MRTLDLSPAMIGSTVRIERDGIAGTHNYIEGILQDFEFSVEHVWGYGSTAPARYEPTSLSARIAGLNFDLDGTEKLSIKESAA